MSTGFVATFNPASPGTPTRATITQDAFLSDVVCPSRSQCIAVDRAGYVETFNPSSPAAATHTVIDSSSLNNLNAVACPSTSQCTAIDFAGYEMTFNPSSPGHPTPTRIDPGASPSGTTQLLAIACPTVSQCTAVDNSGHEMSFNPASPGPPAPVLIAAGAGFGTVACPSRSQCTAVSGGTSNLETTFKPSSPSRHHTTLLGGVAAGAVACPSVSQCTAVGNGGTAGGAGGVVTFDPSSPGKPKATVIDSHGYFQGVACPSVSQCTAVDSAGFEVTSTGSPAKQVCVVPKLKGKTLAAAKKALKKAHCAVGSITSQKSSTVAKGRVISSKPGRGSVRKAGTSVALIVSRGKH